jgi:hypothetical protein
MRMSADHQLGSTLQLVREAVAEHCRSRSRSGDPMSSEEQQEMEMQVLRTQFGFGGLRRLLTDLGTHGRGEGSGPARELTVPQRVVSIGASAGTGGRR